MAQASGQVMDIGIVGDRIVAVGNLAEPADRKRSTRRVVL
jgi:hypothetical protein